MSIETATAAILSKVNKGANLGASVKFNCDADGIIFVDGNASPPTVSNDDNAADCTVKLSLETLEGLIAGSVDATSAFMMGKIKVEGDMGVAMRLSSIL